MTKGSVRIAAWAAIIVLVIVSFCLNQLPAAFGADFGLDGATRTTHFTVHYDSSQALQANLLASVGEEELARVSRDLGYSLEPNNPFPLNIYSSRDAFRASEGMGPSKWTVGTTRSNDASITIDASGLLVLPREVLSHEITHAVIFRMLGSSINALPLWFNEGLAQYESQASQADNDTLVGDIAASGSLPDLADLALTFPPKRMDQAYAVSSSAVRYMITKYGPSSPRTLLHELARTGSFDKAMAKATGMNGNDFAGSWYDYTTARFWMVRITRLVTGVVSALMALLAITAFAVRRRRMQAAARQWEQEELDEAIRRQQGNDWSVLS